jgi:hypothetical protein
MNLKHGLRKHLKFNVIHELKVVLLDWAIS